MAMHDTNGRHYVQIFFSHLIYFVKETIKEYLALLVYIV